MAEQVRKLLLLTIIRGVCTNKAYSEKYVGTATTVNELIRLGSEQPLGAIVCIAYSCPCTDNVEVLYTNTIILE